MPQWLGIARTDGANPGGGRHERTGIRSRVPIEHPRENSWLWHDGRLEVVLSSFILEEMKRVLPRLKRVQLSQSEIEDLVDSFRFLAEVVEPDTAAEPSLRDPADRLCWPPFALPRPIT